MRGISIKAVLVGAITDVVASTIFGIPLGIYVVSSHGLGGLHRDALRAAVVTAVHNSPSLYADQLLIGFGSSVLGGYVAARLARENRRLNAVLAAWLCMGIGVHALITGQDGMSPFVVIFMIALTPLCYLMGALLQGRRAATRSSPA